MPDKPEDIAELVARISLGDRRAFGFLYERTSSKLFAICLRILKDRQEAEDALQEIYVRIWRRAATYRSGTMDAMPWLVAIARNHAIDRIRTRIPARETLDSALDIQDPAPGPESLLAGKSERAHIDRCLEELAPERAQAVVAAYVEGYGYQELADRFGVPINTMRTWLRRSLQSLRRCLGEEEAAADG